MRLKATTHLSLKPMTKGVRSTIIFVLPNLNHLYIDTILHQFGDIAFPSCNAQLLNMNFEYEGVESPETAEDRLASEVFERFIELSLYES